MDITVLLFLIPMSCFLGYMVRKAKADKILIEAICTKVQSGVFIKMRVYHGTYKFHLNGTEYEVYDEEGSNIKPKINKPMRVYVDKNSFSEIVPLAQIRLYQWLIILMVISSVAVLVQAILF